MVLMNANVLYFTSSDGLIWKGIGVAADISVATICMNLELFRMIDSRIAKVCETIAVGSNRMIEVTCQ